jgi:hypothetical protein
MLRNLRNQIAIAGLAQTLLRTLRLCLPLSPNSSRSLPSFPVRRVAV